MYGLLILDIAKVVFHLAFQGAIARLEHLRVVFERLTVILLFIGGITLVKMNFCSIR